MIATQEIPVHGDANTTPLRRARAKVEVCIREIKDQATKLITNQASRYNCDLSSYLEDLCIDILDESSGFFDDHARFETVAECVLEDASDAEYAHDEGGFPEIDLDAIPDVRALGRALTRLHQAFSFVHSEEKRLLSISFKQ